MGIAELSNTEPALRRSWHPVARSADVGAAPHRVLLLGEAWVLLRTGGELRAFLDRCPHRGAPLSLGTCEGDVLACAYHGWRFGPDGRCVGIPALGPDAAIPSRARLEAPTRARRTPRHGLPLPGAVPRAAARDRRGGRRPLHGR